MRILLALTVVLAGACGNAPSKADCDKLLDHLIELEIKQGGAGGDLPPEMSGDVEKQRVQVKDFAAGQKFIETCANKTPKKVVECGLSAKDTCDLQACDQKMSSEDMAACKKDLGK